MIDFDTWQRDNREEARIVQACHGAVTSVVPDAAVILYGSRAQGDAQPDSDYDLLVLVKGDASQAVTWRIRNAVYDVELRSGAVISTIVRPRERWDSPEFGSMPFHRSVMEEGIDIHG